MKNVNESVVIHVLKEVPAGTDVLYQYSLDGQVWTDIDEEVEFMGSSSLYVKLILSTSNSSITPKVFKLLLSKPSIDDRVLMLKTGSQSRFNNVEGDLTLSYDSVKGRLSGVGGPVESFSRSFTPIGLTKKPNPGVYEKITSSVNINTFNFMRVTYKKGYDAEKITVTPSCSIVFTYVGVINP